MLRRLASLSAVLVIVAACQVVGGFETFAGGTLDARTDAAPAPHSCDAIPSTTKVDEKKLAPQVLVKPPRQTCFWVDKYEVSVEQYRKFLDGRNPTAALKDRAHCAWKAAPSDPENEVDDACHIEVMTREQNGFDPTKPIRCVDWCDAHEFCVWAGKELCESQFYFANFEPLDSVDQWGFACAQNGDPYPYGLSPEHGRCNVGLAPTECPGVLISECPPQGPERFPNCTGADGAKDMVGNVAEWSLACAFGDGSADVSCVVRGGGFDSEESRATCAPSSPRFGARNTRARGIGFRCCAPITVEERSLIR